MIAARLNYAETHTRRQQDEKTFALAASLAYQHGLAAEAMLGVAHRLVSDAFARGDDLSGSRAPVVVHDHGGHWTIWRLNGRELEHVVLDGDAARAHGHTLAERLNVPCFVFGRDGELIEERAAVPYHVERDPPPMARLVDVELENNPAPTPQHAGPLKVARHDEQWAVFANGVVLASVRTRDGARKLAKTMAGHAE